MNPIGPPPIERGHLSARVRWDSVTTLVRRVPANVTILCVTTTQDTDYSHRTTVQKLGIKPDERGEIAGGVGTGRGRDVKTAIGRGLVRSGDLDAAIVLVESEDEAREVFVRYRPRLRDTGYLWLITRKRGHDRYLNQMALVPFAKRLGLIDNKTCSIDDERSGIRFVIPRALRRDGQAA